MKSRGSTEKQWHVSQFRYYLRKELFGNPEALLIEIMRQVGVAPKWNGAKFISMHPRSNGRKVTFGGSQKNNQK